MAYKDSECNCDSYCECDRFNPCGCEGMEKDPHCLSCCQHLTSLQEEFWRKEMGLPAGVSSCCGDAVEERILQTYMSETSLYICRACGKDCHSVAIPKEY